MPSGYWSSYNFDKNKITISQGGESAGYVSFQDTRFWAGAHCYVIENSNIINNRFLYHFLKSKESYLSECRHGATIPSLDKKSIFEINISLPNMKIQIEISSILDKFDEYINDINKGLPYEIELRKKQYEYYRNKLLTFEKEN